MKDYEIIEDYEKKLFRAREERNFLKASLNANDAAIEQKKKDLEKLVEGYDELTIRLQKSLKRKEEEIAILEAKLEAAQQVEKENVRKLKAAKKIKQIKKVLEIKPEPEPKPAFIPQPEPEPEEPEQTIEELLEELPTPETQENGKKKCPICDKEFSPQGYASHFKKCSAEALAEIEKEEEEIEQDGLHD